MRTIRTLILDFDGVLVESNEVKRQAFEDLFAMYPPYSRAMMDYHLANHALPRMLKFEHCVYRIMGRPGEQESVLIMAERFSGLVKGRVIECPEVPGAGAFLEEFSRRVPLYVSSVTPRDELGDIVAARGLSRFFKDLFGDPPFRKSEAIEVVLHRERLSPPEVVFVGDSPSDYRAAEEAGLEFIGRNSGRRFDGLDVELHRDLYEIGELLRDRISRSDGYGSK